MRTRLSLGLTLAIAISVWCLAFERLSAQGETTFDILLPLPQQVINGNTLPLAFSFRTPSEAMIIRYDAWLGTRKLVGGPVNNPVAAGSVRLPVDVDISELKLTPGTHTLYVQLTNVRGEVFKREQQIVYKPLVMPTKDLLAPTVRIVKPLDGETITGPTTIKVEATDNSGIKWVMIYVNDRLRAMMNEQPYEIPWNPLADQLGGGTFSLSARALDLFDNEGFSPRISVNVRQSLAGGMTRIERDTPHVIVYDTPGLFHLTKGPSPSDVRSFNRMPYANVVPPLLGGFSTPLPMMTPAPRAFLAATTATGDLLAVLPARTLPGLRDSGMMNALSPFALAVPPALAAPLAPFARPTFGSAMIPTRGTLPVLPNSVAAGREMSSDVPSLIAGVPLFKREPVVSADAPRESAAVSARVANASAPAWTSPDRAAMDAPLALPREMFVTLPASLAEQFTARAAEAGVLVAMAPSASTLPVKHVPAATADSPAAPANADVRNTAVPTAPAHERAAGPAAAAPLRDAHVALPAAGANTVSTRAAQERVLVAMTQAVPGLPDKHAPARAENDARIAAGVSDTIMPRTATPLPVAAGADAPGRLAASDAAHALAPTRDPASRAAAADAPVQGAGAMTATKASPRPAADPVAASTVLGTQAAPQPASRAQARQTGEVTGAPRAAAALGTPTAPGAQARGTTEDAPRVSTQFAQTKLTPAAGAEPLADFRARLTQAVVTQSPAALTAPRSLVEATVDVHVPYTVQAPETLTTIARAVSTTPETLAKLNPSVAPTATLAPGTQIVVPKSAARIYLDNTPVLGGPRPFILDGHSMVPVRMLLEARDGVVIWLPETREVNAWVQNTFIGLQIGKREATINSQTVMMAKPAMLTESRTMVPIRFVATALDMEVVYNPTTGTYYLTSNEVR